MRGWLPDSHRDTLMLTRLLHALAYCVVVVIVAALIVWLVGMFPVPAIIPQLIWALAAIICILVLLGVLTGKIQPIGGGIL